MVTIYRDGTAFVVRINTGFSVEKPILQLSHDCGTEMLAAALVEAVERRLWNKVETIRREAYGEGWRDARAKRRKQTWFSNILPWSP